MQGDSLTSATARGGAYVLIRRLTANGLRLAAVAVLARKLTPPEFGVVALAQMAVSLLTLFGSGGIITYIVCDREVDWQTRVNPAFWLNVMMALGSVAIALAGIPLVIAVYHQPLVAKVLLVILADFFIDQLKMVPDALLQRSLRFRILAIRDTGRDFISSGLAVGMALSGFGVWSLVVPNLLCAPLEVAFTAWAARFRPRLPMGREHWPRIFKFTRNVIGEQILSFFGNEVDTAVVGKVMGSATLGIYNLAYQLANLIGKNVSAVITMVSAPALAAARERKSDIGPPYRKMMRVLSLLGTPMLLGMFVLAHELVFLVYGPRWDGAVPFLRIFIISTLVRSVTSPTGTIFNVVGRPELSVRIMVGFLVLYIPALLVSSRFGIYEIAICVAVARILVGFVALYMALDLISESKLRVAGELARPWIAGAIMAIASSSLDRMLFDLRWTVVARVVVVTATGSVLYFVAAALLARRAMQETFALLAGLVRRRRAKAS